MTRKRKVQAIPQAPAAADIPATERDALVAAFQAGLIAAWKPDRERGYRLTISGRQDEYVEGPKLAKHLEQLAGGA